jgi:hypothetical protein
MPYLGILCIINAPPVILMDIYSHILMILIISDDVIELFLEFREWRSEHTIRFQTRLDTRLLVYSEL